MALTRKRKSPDELKEFQDLTRKKLTPKQVNTGKNSITGKQYTTYLKNYYAISFPEKMEKTSNEDKKREAEIYTPFTAVPLKDEDGIKIYPKTRKGTLAQVFEHDPTRVRLQSLNLFMQLVSAVTEFHTETKLHPDGRGIGDIKPENILIFESSTGEYILKLIDTNSIGMYTEDAIAPEVSMQAGNRRIVAQTKYDPNNIPMLKKIDCYNVGKLFLDILKNEAKKEPYITIRKICINLTREEPDERPTIQKIPEMLPDNLKTDQFKNFKKTCTLKDIQSFNENLDDLLSLLQPNPEEDDRVRLLGYIKQQAKTLLSATTKFIEENPEAQEKGEIVFIKGKAEEILKKFQPTQQIKEKASDLPLPKASGNPAILFQNKQPTHKAPIEKKLTQSSTNKFKFSFSIFLQCLRCLANLGAVLGLTSVFFFSPSNIHQPPTDNTLKKNEEKSPQFRKP